MEGENQAMGASKRIKQILIDKGMTQVEFAEIVMPGKKTATAQVRNLLACDTFRFSTVEQWLDVLGYDIVFVERKTKKQYRP